jgi:MFS family permease
MFFRGLTNGILAPILPLYLRSIGVGVLEWSLLVSVFGAAMISTEAVWGFLSDKIGKETVIVIGMLSMSLIAPSYTLTVWMPLLFALQFLRGAFGVAVGPASRALISDIAQSQKVGVAMGLWYTSIMFGQIVGSILGTYIAVTTTTFAYPLYICAVSSTSGGILALIWLRRSATHTINRVEEPFFRSIKRMLTMRPLQLASALAVILITEEILITAFLPVFAVELFEATPTDIGISLATFNAVCVAVTLLLGRASDRFGRRLTVALGMIVCGLADLSYISAASLAQMLLATVGVAIGFSLVAPSLLALLTDVTTPEERGTAMGIYGVFEDIGVMAGPPLYGYAWKNQGVTSIFYLSAALQAIGLALTPMLRKTKK